MLGASNLFTGGVSGVVADVKLIMAIALKSLSSGIILCHNHPSGNIQSSEADNRLTKQIREASKLFDIATLDHLILTQNSFYSYAEEGEI